MKNKTLTKRQKTIQAQRSLKHIMSTQVLPDMMLALEQRINESDHASVLLESDNTDIINDVVKKWLFKSEM
jgi:hypothetical protein